LYSAAHGGEADVVEVRVAQTGAGVWRFTVAVRHADTGWDHYADRWDVVGPDGAVLASRVLMHPHVDEQPFKRSLTGVAIPADVDRVRLRLPGHRAPQAETAGEIRLRFFPEGGSRCLLEKR